jgi:hypothetical protein
MYLAAPSLRSTKKWLVGFDEANEGHQTHLFVKWGMTYSFAGRTSRLCRELSNGMMTRMLQSIALSVCCTCFYISS